MYRLSWQLNGKTYSELRITEHPQRLKTMMESLACREWPITNVEVV